MLLTEFLKTHNNWEELLSEPPYSVKIKRDGGYVIFLYNQLFSDFTSGLVRECRGVILEEATLKPVCVPFYKFGNYGESYVPPIDWNCARVQEKIDGSLIKLWYDNGAWHVSTNGTINAYAAELERTDLFEENCPYKSYGDLFEAASKKAGLDYGSLDKNNTYMFELVSPYNKVIVLYDELEIYHIGTRNNLTLAEEDLDIGVKKPRQFSINSLESCIEHAKNLPSDKEGYVVVDKYYNRVKVKNPVYVALHHLKNNGDVNLSNFISIVRKNEIEEYVTYFPEFASKIYGCKRQIESIIQQLEDNVRDLSQKVFPSQKDFALEVKDMFLCRYYFEWFKDNGLTAKEWLWRMTDDKIKKLLNGIGFDV